MSRKSQRRPIQKRSFLLVELLLSMGLLMLCLFPLIKTHVGILRAEVKQIEAIKDEQEAQKCYCELKQKLFEHTHSWKELMKPVEGEFYKLTKLKQSTKHSKQSGLVLGATIYTEKNQYERTVYVEKTHIHTR